VVLTNSSSIAAKQFFQDQDNCSFYYKTELLPAELADIVLRYSEDRGGSFTAEIASCPRGRRHAKCFEDLSARILEYLFVPPLTRVVRQSRRADGRTIRDAVMPNDASSFFWATLRSELDARHIVAEFKNYVRAIGKEEVVQLREYLGRKTIGRFGLLISRTSPSGAAVAARRDAYTDQGCLILFLDDRDVIEMIGLRRRGRDPVAVLQRMKEEFELAY